MEPNQAERRPRKSPGKTGGVSQWLYSCVCWRDWKVVCSDVWQGSCDFCHVRLFISKGSSSPDARVWTDGEQAGVDFHT